MSENTQVAVVQTSGTLVTAKKNALPIMSMNDIAVMGNFVGQSRMFGAKNQAEGIMIVGICQQEGWSYADFMANFDIINGKLSKKPAAMLADYVAKGGSYEIVQRDGEGSIIEFKKGKQKFRSECLWADAKKEPLPYDCREADAVAMLSRGQVPPLKPKYATPRARMQMLWARCVSDGLRAFDSSCCKGIYTPEEVEDFATPVAYIAPAPAPDAPSPVAASSSPISVEVCPAGPLAGKRWDGMDVTLLEQALNVAHPSFTPEMKDYIRGLVAAKKAEATAAVNAVPEHEAETVEAEVVS